MKNFTFLFTLLLLSLGIAFQASATSYCDCENNKLSNGGFESGTNGWTTVFGSFGTNDYYKMCGSKGGVIGDNKDKPAKIYQDVNITGGSEVTLTVYGGTHNKWYDHTFSLIFLDSNGNPVGDAVVKQVDYVVNSSKLEKYTLVGTAPSNAVKVRFQAYAQKDYLKIDAACMKVKTKTPVSCECVDNNQYIKNASFENGTADWQWVPGQSHATFSKDDGYNMCGDKNGLLYKKGKIYQDISLVPGSLVQISAYGGTHTNDNWNRHYFKITFYDGQGNLLGDSSRVLMDHIVGGDKQLKKFDVSATAPAGSVKARFTVESTGDYFKVDAVCTTVTQPITCLECNGNTLKNASFEDGTNNWSVTGTLSVDALYAVCGSKGAVLTGAGKFWQDVEVQTTFGSQVSLTIYGAFDNANSQVFQLLFLDEMQAEIGQVTKEVTKSLTTSPWGLEKYTLSGTLPSNTKYVRVLASSAGGTFVADNACLVFSGPPLPVTLSAFSAKKEGATAQLTWATTYETNSAYFEVQHSQDGKKWTALTQLDAKGESKQLETYTYTHTNPFAVNLYRLKMVDLDETFAYSAIKSLNFDGQEQMNVYPNPTVDRIKVSSNQLVTNVKVYSANGVLVLSTKPDPASEVDLTRLSQGTYFVKINDGPLMRKILIVR